MLSFLRQLARALTGRVDALEFALGILFGLLLGLIPPGAIDPGTGILGLNGLWLLILIVCLVLRASIPVAFVFAAVAKLLAMLFLDAVAHDFGRAMLGVKGGDGTLPQSVALGFADGLPSWQLHTHWGFGITLIAFALAIPAFLVGYFVLRAKLPVWRERFGRTRFARTMSNVFVFRVLGRLLR